MQVIPFFKNRQLVNSIGLAILLCANSLSWIYPVSNIILSFAVFSLIVVLLNNPFSVFLNSKFFVVLAVALLFFFSYTYGVFDRNSISLYLFSFFAFGVTGLLYSSVEFSYKVFYRVVLFISILVLPVVFLTISQGYSNSSVGDIHGFFMGISQGALRLTLALIVIFVFKEENIVKQFSLLIVFFYMYFYIDYGTRSAILSLLLFVSFSLMIKLKKLNYKNFLFLSIVFVLFLYFYIDFLIILKSLGLNVKAFDKIIFLDQFGSDVSNGRNSIWLKALSDFSESPVFGYGVSSFELRYGTYPHNYILQVLHEGGLLYFSFIIPIFILFLHIIFSVNYNSQVKVFLLYLFFSGILELFFSNVYWRNVTFWFFIGFVIEVFFNKKHRNFLE